MTVFWTGNGGQLGVGSKTSQTYFLGTVGHALLLSVLFPALAGVRSPPKLCATSSSSTRNESSMSSHAACLT